MLLRYIFFFFSSLQQQQQLLLLLLPPQKQQQQQNFVLLFQDSIFRCNLETQFRNQECKKSNLLLSYVESNIASPQFGNQSYSWNFFYHNNVLVFFLSHKNSFLVFLEKLRFKFAPTPHLGIFFLPTKEQI